MEWSEGNMRNSGRSVRTCECRAEVRTSIVASKRGNSRGAKGCRKVDVSCQVNRKDTVASAVKLDQAETLTIKLKVGGTDCLDRNACWQLSIRELKNKFFTELGLYSQSTAHASVCQSLTR